MSSSLDSGSRPRPSPTYNWFDRLLIGLHIKPSHRQKHIRDVLRIEELLADISRRCRNNGLRYSIEVDWKNKRVSFKRPDKVDPTSLSHEMSFDELLSDDFNPQMFVALTLYRKY